MRRYLLAILWTAVILLASSDFFSAAHTGEWLVVTFRFLGFTPQPANAGIWNAIWRKGAHFGAYAALGALWFGALRGDDKRRWFGRWAWIAIVIAFSVAVTDEVHQSFIPSRTGSPFDVLLDTCSAALAVLLFRL
jgi:VanZ family protein